MCSCFVMHRKMKKFGMSPISFEVLEGVIEDPCVNKESAARLHGVLSSWTLTEFARLSEKIFKH